MKRLIAILYLSITTPSASAQIFKCEHEGHSIFSDTPCGENAKAIVVAPPVRNDTMVSNQKLKTLADQMHISRRKRELRHHLKRQRNHVKRIEKDYTKKRNALHKQLDKVLASKDGYRQGGSALQRKKLEDKEANIRSKLSNEQQKYYAEKETARSELKEITRQRNQYD